MAANPSTESLTIAQLRELRLKPAPGQLPDGSYWQGFRHVATYARAQAVPMGPKREISEAQRQALARGRAMAGTSPCAGGCGARIDGTPRELARQRRAGARWVDMCDACRDREIERQQQEHLAAARVTARQWLAADPVFLDTETTGLDSRAEVIEVCVLDAAGVVLLDSLARPAQACAPAARQVHGISDEMLANAPGWTEIAGHLASVLAGRLVIAHNAEFDERCIRHSCRVHGVRAPAPAKWCCTMDLLTDPVHEHWPSLDRAMRIAGAGCEDVRHRARGDAERVRRIVRILAGS